jgi:trigger factor
MIFCALCVLFGKEGNEYCNEVRMKVQIETMSPYERKIFFEIPAHIVSEQLESTYRALNRNVKIKGFRPGKVPRSILNRYYKAQIEEEVVSKMITDSFTKAVEENHLFPVAEPVVLDRVFKEGENFTYTVTVEVKPEITVDQYSGLEIEMPAINVSEEEVEAQVKNLQDSHAQLKPLDSPRPIREKDFVILDFEGTQSGKPLEGWKVNNHLVEVGSKTLVGDLDLQLIGLSPNEEKEVSLPLPENYPKKGLAGKEIRVHLKVKEIKEKILPLLDDEWAKDVGNFSSLADLKARLRQTLEEQKKGQANQAGKEKILDLLIERHPFQVPKSLIERQMQNLISRAEIRLAQQGMKLEEANLDRQKMQESFQPMAERDVRGNLILEKIAEIEKISVSDADLEEKFEKLAAQLKQRPETVKNYYQKKDLGEGMRAQILEEKTLDFLMSQAKITTVNNALAATPAGAFPEEK